MNLLDPCSSWQTQPSTDPHRYRMRHRQSRPPLTTTCFGSLRSPPAPIALTFRNPLAPRCRSAQSPPICASSAGVGCCRLAAQNEFSVAPVSRRACPGVQPQTRSGASARSNSRNAGASYASRAEAGELAHPRAGADRSLRRYPRPRAPGNLRQPTPSVRVKRGFPGTQHAQGHLQAGARTTAMRYVMTAVGSDG